MIKKFYWHSPENVIDTISEKYKGKKVLDVGAGKHCLDIATHIVDILELPNFNGRKIYNCDVCIDGLPFNDNEFDFIFCRQTLEDTYNPLYVCKEMIRVGKAGYIETPSVIQEFCRLNSKDATILCRGHGHHLYFIWYDGNVLHLLPKYPIVEHIKLVDESFIYNILNKGCYYWHNCFFWENSFNIKFYYNSIDYSINGDEEYLKIIQKAMNISLNNTNTFYSELTGMQV